MDDVEAGGERGCQLRGCGHRWCDDCLKRHVRAAMDEGVRLPPRQPPRGQWLPRHQDKDQDLPPPPLTIRSSCADTAAVRSPASQLASVSCPGMGCEAEVRDILPVDVPIFKVKMGTECITQYLLLLLSKRASLPPTQHSKRRATPGCWCCCCCCCCCC